MTRRPPETAERSAALIGRLKLGGTPPRPQIHVDRQGRFLRPLEPYDPITATPTEKLKQLTVFRAVHPLYGLFLMDYLGKADEHELIQILESLLEMPGSVAKSVRVPWPDELPAGPTRRPRWSTRPSSPAASRRRTTSTRRQTSATSRPSCASTRSRWRRRCGCSSRARSTTPAACSSRPSGRSATCSHYGGDFDQFVRARDLVKQEGILFKHLLRMILLCDEFAQLTPTDTTPRPGETLMAISDAVRGLPHRRPAMHRRDARGVSRACDAPLAVSESGLQGSCLTKNPRPIRTNWLSTNAISHRRALSMNP